MIDFVQGNVAKCQPVCSGPKVLSAFQFWGTGTHQWMGNISVPDVVLSVLLYVVQVRRMTIPQSWTWVPTFPGQSKQGGKWGGGGGGGCNNQDWWDCSQSPIHCTKWQWMRLCNSLWINNSHTLLGWNWSEIGPIIIMLDPHQPKKCSSWDDPIFGLRYQGSNHWNMQ